MTSSHPCNATTFPHVSCSQETMIQILESCRNLAFEDPQRDKRSQHLVRLLLTRDAAWNVLAAALQQLNSACTGCATDVLRSNSLSCPPHSLNSAWIMLRVGCKLPRLQVLLNEFIMQLCKTALTGTKQRLHRNSSPQTQPLVRFQEPDLQAKST